MSAYANQVKEYVQRYQIEIDANGMLDPHAVAEWAYRNGLHKPNPRTVIDAIAADIAQVFREEYRTDKSGQRYRAMHAVRSRTGNRTMSLWADMDDERAPRDHFVRSFAQRRQQIVGDCFQLMTDVDVYNSKCPEQQPIQLVLDFTNDIEELRLPLDGRKAA
jgi:hypothetical protein